MDIMIMLFLCKVDWENFCCTSLSAILAPLGQQGISIAITSLFAIVMRNFWLFYTIEKHQVLQDEIQALKVFTKVGAFL